MKSRELENFESVRKMIGELSLLTRSENTKRTYLKGILKFIQYKQIQDLDSFVEEVRKSQNQNEIVKDFAVYLASKNLAPKSVAAWVSSLKKFFRCKRSKS